MKAQFRIYEAVAVLLFVAACFSAPVGAQFLSPEQKAEVDAKMKEAAAAPTPRTADGHPDLTGYWGEVIGMFGFDGKAFITADQGSAPGRALFNSSEANKQQFVEQSQANYDKTLGSRIDYKSQFRDQVKDDFLHPEKNDPTYRCEAPGVPRLGAPNEIFATKNAVVLLYENPYDNPDHFTYRVVPTDGRQHDPDADDMTLGDSVGRWEGDTLVIDVTHLSPKTWVGKGGSIHDANLHVVERITRRGNTLEYAVTLDDPTMFEKPYSPAPTKLILKPDEHSHEDYPCVERDRAHMDGNR
jgi:hypothetical protein